jgi:hypothetical protein
MTALDRLKSSVQILSSSIEKQIKFLNDFGNLGPYSKNLENVPDDWNIDELGLQFGDVEILVPGMLKRQELTEEQAERAAEVGKMLQRWSGRDNKEFWTIGALKSDPRWEQVRDAAAKVFPDRES